MIGTILNTAGEAERERRSRRWNLLEAMGLACAAVFFAWPVAFGWGILGGNHAAREGAAIPLYLIMVFAFLVSPFIHGDTAESWGLGNPRRLWRMFRDGPRGRRARLTIAVLALVSVVACLIFGHWPKLVRFFHLPPATAHWPATTSGAIVVLAIALLLAMFLATCAIRYDNFGAAFKTALTISAILVLVTLAGAVMHRGWAALDRLGTSKFILYAVGYFFWGYFQQLFFCAWFGTRLRKSFGPSTMPGNVRPRLERRRLAMVGGVIAAAVLAPAGWFTVRSLYGPAAVGPWLLGWFFVFSFPIGAVWGWFLGQDRKRLLVATLSGSFFGLIHMDSYGLVAVTWVLGTILAWVFMEDRNRNLAALGIIHGLLGATFGQLFNKGDPGVLRVDYRVGPWNVQEPAAAVLIIPLLCLVVYVALTVWLARRVRERER